MNDFSATKPAQPNLLFCRFFDIFSLASSKSHILINIPQIKTDYLFGYEMAPLSMIPIQHTFHVITFFVEDVILKL